MGELIGKKHPLGNIFIKTRKYVTSIFNLTILVYLEVGAGILTSSKTSNMDQQYIQKKNKEIMQLPFVS